MNFEEHAAKPLLKAAGIAVPDGRLARTADDAAKAFDVDEMAENLNFRHFINVTHLVTEIPEDKPSEEELFGDYWAKYEK